LTWPALCANLFSPTATLIMSPEFLWALHNHTKRVSRRVWTPAYTKPHLTAFTLKQLVRVWRAYGHKYTIGWVLYTHAYYERLGDITDTECVLEGCPHEKRDAFILNHFTNKKEQEKRKKKNISPITEDTIVLVLRFIFFPSRSQ
jgi:hypothetical protein